MMLKRISIELINDSDSEEIAVLKQIKNTWKAVFIQFFFSGPYLALFFFQAIKFHETKLVF